jgi:signal transduction histidine kinase
VVHDRVQLEQVEANLLDNAIKHANGRANRGVEQRDGDRAVLRVRDTGSAF